MTNNDKSTLDQILSISFMGLHDRKIDSPVYTINNPKDLMKTIVRANDGDPQHQCYLAQHFDLFNHKEFAIYWYGLAADHGIPTAMHNLAQMLYHGVGIAENKEEAANWYRSAADKGDTQSQLILGHMLSNGDGIPANRAESAKWYQLAVRQARLGAEQGDKKAQLLLGTSYIIGMGVKANHFNAYMLFTLAARNGQKDAEYLLNLYKQHPTRERFAEAEKRAREWVVGTPLPLEE